VTRTESATRKRATIAAGLGGSAVLLVCWFFWRPSPPQMGGDGEVAKAVDALFTAVTARDERLVGQCEQRLSTLKDDGKLPGDAGEFLDGVIRDARDGSWEPAAARLYGFMKAQRRPRVPNRRTQKQDHGGGDPGKQ
jgi:hypothetical protein